ncbi:MAG: hypothetical protein ACJAR3_002545 [Roseivirga sp.]|jgi:hypothetical protein
MALEYGIVVFTYKDFTSIGNAYALKNKTDDGFECAD